MKYIRSSIGISLVEVLAGFIILTIILISFMSILVQTKKTNASSEEIQEATYLAQAEMEEIYLKSDSGGLLGELSASELEVNHKSYIKKSETSSDYNECKNVTSHQKVYSIIYEGRVEAYISNLKIDLTCRPNNNILGRVMIELVDPSLNSSKAKIENAYIWK